MDVRVRLVLRIIEERGGAMNMSSEQMASLLGLSETRVLRLFHAEVGKTFRRHLLEVRMKRATEMLTDYKIPIKAIATRFGYTAVNNFYRDFKMVHGTSPVQMRLMLMEAPLLAHHASAVHSASFSRNESAQRDIQSAPEPF